MPRPVLPPGKGRPKGTKNKSTLFKEAWKAGLEKAVGKAGGPEQFVKDWLATRQGKSELNSHMLKVVHPVAQKVDVDVSGGIEVLIVDHVNTTNDNKKAN